MAIDDARRLGAAVRAARKERELTQASLAAQAGVSRAWLARFETGHPAASIEQVFLVLRALGLSLQLTESRISEGEATLLAALAAEDRR